MTTQQLTDRVQTAGELRLLADGYWRAYLLALAEDDADAKSRHIEQWRRNAMLSQDADATLYRYMLATEHAQVVSHHFKASIEDHEGKPYIKITDRKTGKVIE